jgi:hypothetical protein
LIILGDEIPGASEDMVCSAEDDIDFDTGLGEFGADLIDLFEKDRKCRDRSAEG